MDGIESPYGSTYDFIQLDYVDANNISMLRVTGVFSICRYFIDIVLKIKLKIKMEDIICYFII